MTALAFQCIIKIDKLVRCMIKKFVCLLLSLMVISSVLTACKDSSDHTTDTILTEEKNSSAEVKKWDGSVATGFENGNGSEIFPYLIANASQLAYLAQTTNSGTDYSGKYFLLDGDIDLNHMEWTPIGNGAHPFNGYLDGKEHTISNLKITKGINFEVSLEIIGTVKKYAIGLFGRCENAVIKNLTIDNADIKIQETVERDTIMAGILTGVIQTTTSSEISNIALLNSTITSDFRTGNSPSSLRIGGISGCINSEENATCKIGAVQSDLKVSVENGYGSYNHIGGIVGTLSVNGYGYIQDCASYASVVVDTQSCYYVHNYFGAFGALSARKEIVSISNIFSKVTTNKIYDGVHRNFAYNVYAIIGETGQIKQQDGTLVDGFHFESLFGYVEQIDETTNEKQMLEQLYSIPKHAIYTETNCQGCTSLPTNNGFDDMIWNLDDLSDPQLK